MNQLVIETGILLGLDFLENQMDCPSNSEIVAEGLNEGDTPCLLSLQSHLKSLLETSDLFYLSKTLSLSPFFLLLLKQDPCISGYCLICDNYYQNLEIHFNLFHKLNRDVFQRYRIQFSSGVEAFFPFKSSQKKLKVKAPLYFSNPRSRTLKIHWKKGQKPPGKPKPSKTSEEASSNQPIILPCESSVIQDWHDESLLKDSLIPEAFPILSKECETSGPALNTLSLDPSLLSPSLIQHDTQPTPFNQNHSKSIQIKSESEENSDDILELQEILEISTKTKRKKKQPSPETFICEYCFKSISISSKKSHIYCHKRNETVQCPDCGESFKYRNQKSHKDRCLSQHRILQEP